MSVVDLIKSITRVEEIYQKWYAISD